MDRLQQGNEQFIAQVYPEMAAHFTKLCAGQRPWALFITCSDSRVDPTLITHSQPGELFVTRNAGNLVTAYGVESSMDAVVEYAVVALGVKEIIVCGHSGCGAITGLLEPTALKGLPAVARWVSRAQGTVACTEHLPAGERLAGAISHNAQAQLLTLQTHPSVMAGLQRGTLHLSAWVYDIESGRVSLHDRVGAPTPGGSA